MPRRIRGSLVGFGAHDLPGSQVRRPIRLTGFTKNRAGVLVNTLNVESPHHLTTLKMLIVVVVVITLGFRIGLILTEAGVA